MKFLDFTFKNIFIILIICLFAKMSPAQHNWFWQNPLPQGNTLNSVDFGDENTGWAVGENGTIIKSTDSGENWNLQYSGTTERLHSVHAFNENTIYAVSENGAVLKSINSGANWSSQGGGTSIINRSYFFDENIGWVIGNNGVILKTTNAGNNWSAQSSGTTNDLFGLYFTSVDSGTVVGDSGTVLKTTNGGNTWIPFVINPGLENFTESSQLNEDRINDIWEANDDFNVLVGNNGRIGIWNNGVWSEPNSGVSFDLHRVRAVTAGNALLLVAIGDNGCIIYSIDSGRVWQTSFFESGDLKMLYLASAGFDWSTHTTMGNAILITGGEYGRIGSSTNNGVTWSAISSGSTRHLLSIFSIGSNIWSAGHFSGGGSILASTDGGSTWINRHPGTTNTLNDIHFTNENTGWIAGRSGTIRKTTNGGANWSSQTSGTSSVLNSIYFINSSKGWAVGEGNTILHTTDGGDSWSNQTSGTSNVLFSVCFADENNGWIAGGSGTISATTNGGVDWTLQLTGTTSSLRSVFAVNVNTVYAVGSAGTVIKTTNGGAAWNTQPTGTSNQLRSVYFFDENSGWAAGANGSIIRTTNGGINWMVLASMTGNDLDAVVFNDANTGWVAGDGGAILKTITGGGTVSISIISSSIPDGFTLYQNYPNPFNPSTKIDFDIPKSGLVSLKVYDLLGKEVASLVNNNLIAGSYTLDFNGVNLSSGVYFYRLQSNGFNITKKMLLAK